MQLAPEDLNLVTRLVLESGSLKAVASAYGVSYPTIRRRVDGLIERLRRLIEGRPRDPLSEHLAELVERGELRAGAAREILAAAEARDVARRAAHNTARAPGQKGTHHEHDGDRSD